MEIQIALGDRLRVAGRAFRALFKQPTSQDILGVYAGLFPGGPGSPPPRGIAELIKSYGDMPWVNAVVGKIASGIACAQWRVYVVRSKTGDVKWRKDLQRADFDTRQRLFKLMKRDRELEEVLDHPLPQVLEASNSFALGLTTKRLTQIYLELVGEAYWIKERNDFGMPIALWPLPPHWVMATPTVAKPHFEVKFMGWQGNIPVSEVVWFVHPDPSNPYGRGVGIAKSLADELETDEYAAKHMKAFFYNRARPDIIVSGKGLRETETKRLEQDWIQKLQGFWRTFKPYFISGEVKVDVIAQNFEHLQLMELRKHVRDTVMQVEGLPPELQGVIENSNRATIDSADYLFSRWTLVPRLEFLRATMQERLVPDYDERLILDYDSPVQEDKEFNLKVAQASPWSTMLDEWRAMRGAEPLPNEQGKVFMVPFGLNPVPLQETETFMLPDLALPAVDDGNPTGEEEEGDDTGAVEEAIAARRLANKGLKGGDIEALVMIQRVARRMQPEMRKAFLFAVEKAKKEMSYETIVAAFEARNSNAVLDAVPLAQFEKEFSEKGEKVLKQTLKLAGDHAAKLLAKELGLPVSFDLTNIRAVTWIRRNGAEMVTNVTAKTRAAIVQAIERAIIEGRPPVQAALDLIKLQFGLNKQQEKALAAFQAKLVEEGAFNIEDRVAKYAKALERKRSLMIARTETLNASNGGQQTLWLEAKDAGYLDPNKVSREWLVTDDDRLDAEVCFLPTTKILTIDGWRAISKLKPGNFVLTHRDRFRKVLNVSWKHYDGKVVRMKLGGQSRLQATATYGHKILTKRGWIPVEELTHHDEIVVSAVPCQCGGLLPFGLAKAPICLHCSREARIEGNKKRWAKAGEKEKLSARNRLRWSIPENRQRASEWMLQNNPARTAEVRVKLRESALRRPPRPKKQKPAAADWMKSPNHPFRRADIKRSVAKRLVEWRAGLNPERKREIEQKAIRAGLIGCGKNSKGSSFLERKVKSFLETQGIAFEPQWHFSYKGDRERHGFADFYIPGANLVIECDGFFHSNTDVRERDELIMQSLIRRGVTVLRFNEDQIRNRFGDVASEIRTHCCLTSLRPAKLIHSSIKRQVIYDIEVEEDHSFIAGGIVAHNCEPMDGQERGLEEAFQTGDGRRVMHPSAHPDCRCSMRLRFKK